jgi:hypothetical protein
MAIVQHSEPVLNNKYGVRLSADLDALTALQQSLAVRSIVEEQNVSR